LAKSPVEMGFDTATAKQELEIEQVSQLKSGMLKSQHILFTCNRYGFD
jgi:hypothetical protein